MDTVTLLAGAFSTLTLIYLYNEFKTFTYWSSRGIKGPTPWPLLGTNIHYVFKDRVHVDEKWRKEYGRVYGIYEGHEPVLRVSDAELLQRVYIKQFASFTDRNNKIIHGETLKRWLFWSSGSHWANQRALSTTMFTSSKIKTMFNSMSECAKDFVREINSRLSSLDGYSTNGSSKQDNGLKSITKQTATQESVISKDELMAYALDVMGRSFFSLKLDTYKDKSSDFFKRAFAFARFDLPRFFLWLIIPNFIAKRIKFDLVSYSQYEYFDKLSQSIIDERRKTGDKKINIDFIQALLDAQIPETHENVHTADDDKDAHYNANIDHVQLDKIFEKQSKKVQFRKFEDLEIRAQMTFFFLAGFETTSSSLSFCFYSLAHEKGVQEEIYDELKSHQQIDYSSLSSLKKLDAFVSEALRLYAPVTEHNRIVTAKEGVVLPWSPPIKLDHRASVSVPGLVVQRDPTYWEDPLRFDMTRFYPENRAKIVSGSYMPFGLGPRNCLGMRFALLNIKLAVASLLLKYKVSPGPNSGQYPPEFNRHSFFLQLKHTDFKLTPREKE